MEKKYKWQTNHNNPKEDLTPIVSQEVKALFLGWPNQGLVEEHIFLLLIKSKCVLWRNCERIPFNICKVLQTCFPPNKMARLCLTGGVQDWAVHVELSGECIVPHLLWVKHSQKWWFTYHHLQSLFLHIQAHCASSHQGALMLLHPEAGQVQACL